MGKRMSLINNFGEKFEREKGGSFLFNYKDNEIYKDNDIGQWILRNKAHENEISLPEDFISLRAEGNVLILMKKNTEIAFRIDTPKYIAVINPIDSNQTSYFKMLAGKNVNKLKLNYNSRGFTEVGNEILDATISFCYSPLNGWEKIIGRNSHGEPVKLNQ